ncbi:MAG: NAD(P)/FAD-dependent oxidoreductase [Pseudomonadota bacterium]
MAPHSNFDAIILGGGGAGLMVAARAGQGGARVVVVDHNAQVGRKILISGGGRCNFTNVDAVPERYLSANPHFAKSALSRYRAQDFIALVDRYGIAWHEKTLGQLFCDGSAKQIVQLLLSECDAGQVAFRLGHSVDRVTLSEGTFSVTVGSETLAAPNLVVATGGPSIPKLGASDFAYRLARQFSLKIVEPRPALVPFTLAQNERLFTELSGVAAPTRVSCGKQSFDEASLFTHKGLSGPAMLQISSYWRHGQAVSVNFAPAMAGDWLVGAKQAKPGQSVGSVLAELLPERLAQTLLALSSLDPAKRVGDFRDTALQHLQARLRNWAFHPNGTEGFAKAEVTIGGISTAELSSRTMEAKKVPGLYAIGEAVDVTGWLGGYNFQWAWASGVAAGEAIAQKGHH